jgi:hypothetical protein
MLQSTSQERYQKLRRVFVRLMGCFNRDDLDDFIQTANSLPNWIRRDSSLCQEQREHLESFVAGRSLDWQICHQIANAQKHVRVNNRNLPTGAPVVRSVDSGPGGRGFAEFPSMQTFGAGEEIFIEYDEKRESAIGFVLRTFWHFHYIFEMAPIPPSQRVIPSVADILG